MSLFSNGRKADEFWNSFTTAEYQSVPRIIGWKANVLAVNLWDVCGRKKTIRPNFEVPPTIKRHLFSFMRTELDPGGRYDPSLSRAALTAITRAQQQKTCDQILHNLVNFCTGFAKKGYMYVDVATSDIFPKDLGWNIPPDKITPTPTTKAESDWVWLLAWLRPLRATCAAAGFTLDATRLILLDKKQNDQEEESGPDSETEKVWKMHIDIDD
mmetsp:Transcript_10451/g.25584  ORF Transcript_10451/g.25584 Transcript_10451/m.25584 type:complete len:213 (-) Transcript_10451:249-887(-)|eukprot:g5627.t1